MDTITKVEAIILDIPTVRGHVMSMATMRTLSTVLVRVHYSDGGVGHGEGATIGGLSYGTESSESIKSAIDHYIAPLLIGMQADAVNEITNRIGRHVRGNPIARSAVETALWDGLARRMGVSLSDLLGGRTTDWLPVVWGLASGNTETDVEEARSMIEAGRHNAFKIKIGKQSVREDIAHVAALRSALGEDVSLRVDVNQGWTFAEAQEGLAGLQDLGVDLVEQPTDAADLAALGALTATHRLSVMADEALQGPKDALRVAAGRAADAFSIKLGQSGGVRGAAEVIAIAQAAGLTLYGGTMLETGLGTAVGLQLFSTVDRLEWGTEMFGPLLLTDEILTEPLLYRDFGVEVPIGPGVGVELDPDKVAFYRRDRTTTTHRIAG